MNNARNDEIKMPFSEDAERGLICSLMRGGDAVAVEVTVPSRAFYIPAHQLVWETLCDLVAEKRPTEFVIVKHRLSKLSQLEEVGGVEYLSSLYGFVPTWVNFKHYAEIVLSNYRIRNAIQSTQRLLERLNDCNGETWNELRGSVENALAEMVVGGDDGEMTTREITLAWMDELASRRERLNREGVGFGLIKLDQRLGMQQPGEVVTIGAPTSSGKSMLAYQGIAHNIAVKRLPVGLISVEMTASQTWDRLASHMQKVPMNAFRDGEFDREQMDRLHTFHNRMIAEMPFYFYGGRRIDIDGVKSWARRVKARYGIKLLVVDYLQRVGLPGWMQRMSREQQVSYVSSELKSLALDLGIVIWCPVQLNKDGDVRESSTIQFDADIAFRILLEKNSYVSGAIVFDKIRQAARGEDLPISIVGVHQTIYAREDEEPAI
jgi:replicative DNA helicase